jgi:hypothetical protein
MCERITVSRLLLALLFGLLVTATPASAFDLKLTGVDDEAMVSGEERDEIRAHGDGATLVLHDRVGCHLDGAHCEELHGGEITTGHCEDVYGRGVLTLRNGTRWRFFVAGNRCPHAGADVERGTLVSRRGFVEYVMRTRRAAPGTHRERVTIRLRSRRAMPRSELQCSGCKYLAHYLHSATPPEPTEAEVVRAVERACDYFPQQYQGLCQVVVDNYGQQIIREFLQLREAVEVCQRVNACPTRRTAGRCRSG